MQLQKNYLCIAFRFHSALSRKVTLQIAPFLNPSDLFPAWSATRAKEKIFFKPDAVSKKKNVTIFMMAFLSAIHFHSCAGDFFIMRRHSKVVSLQNCCNLLDAQIGRESMSSFFQFV